VVAAIAAVVGPLVLRRELDKSARAIEARGDVADARP